MGFGCVTQQQVLQQGAAVLSPGGSAGLHQAAHGVRADLVDHMV
jgi:hypothetical protein